MGLGKVEPGSDLRVVDHHFCYLHVFRSALLQRGFQIHVESFQKMSVGIEHHRHRAVILRRFKDKRGVLFVIDLNVRSAADFFEGPGERARGIT